MYSVKEVSDASKAFGDAVLSLRVTAFLEDFDDADEWLARVKTLYLDFKKKARNS